MPNTSIDTARGRVRDAFGTLTGSKRLKGQGDAFGTLTESKRLKRLRRGYLDKRSNDAVTKVAVFTDSASDGRHRR
jgi:hypothetical protein